MTTVIGIKTNDESGALILAADRQVTIEYEDKSVKRTNFKKLYHDKAQQFAFGFSGLINDTLSDFYENLMEQDADKVITTLKGKVFKEVKELNIKNAVGKEQKEFDEENTSSFIFGTREGSLYLIHPMGAIEPAKFIAIGSGSEYAEAFLEKEIDDNSIARKDIDIGIAIGMAVGALKAANRDVSTSGIDITIINKRGIRNYGDEIYQAMEEAKKRKVDQIIRKYQRSRKAPSRLRGKAQKKASTKRKKKKPTKKKNSIKKPKKKRPAKQKPAKKKPKQSLPKRKKTPKKQPAKRSPVKKKPKKAKKPTKKKSPKRK